MDLITLAMAKKYTDSQRIGYTERKELASFQLTPNADIGMNMGVSMGAIGLEVGKTYTVTTDSRSYTAVCKEMSGTLLLGNANFIMDTLDNTGETFCVVEMDDGAGLMTVAMDANNGTHMKVSAETIVPIDPKYLPNTVVDFDKLGLTAPILELFNTGGGTASMKHDNAYGVDIDAAVQAFPVGEVFVAKMTIPNMGSMVVTPIYSLSDQFGFKSAHFDSYITQSGALLKFYVRAIRGCAADGSTIQFNIEVGFYT